MAALMRVFQEQGFDPETEITRRIYEDLRVDPIVAENRWNGLFTDLNAMLTEMSRQGGNNGQ